MQALHLLALAPVGETIADPNSYGFREQRSCADAVGQCYLALRSANTQWVLEGDIKACFDTISRDWLLTHVPMDKVILEKWLTAGDGREEDTQTKTSDGPKRNTLRSTGGGTGPVPPYDGFDDMVVRKHRVGTDEESGTPSHLVRVLDAADAAFDLSQLLTPDGDVVGALRLLNFEFKLLAL